ncbi:maternal effect protein oskar [Stomoxys calcitrans]|uniref:maternal effect protein oskar n=1 Tax=Stomoxys calcitrans TaxID=35570 RepID=UPI0027E336B4|nr:maternal effect protein oskar [Stomoxys calcitrans]
MIDTKPTTKCCSKKAEEETNTLKPDLNSVSNGRKNFLALKRHITTCIQRWRQKDPSKRLNKKCKLLAEHHQQNQQQQKEEYQCSCQQRNSGNKWFRKYTCKEFFASSSLSNSFAQRCTFNATNINKVPFAYQEKCFNSTNHDYIEGPRKYGRKVEIVARLLSSTLIGRDADKPKPPPKPTAEKSFVIYRSQRRDSGDSAYHSVQDSLEIYHNFVTSTTVGATDINKMTIPDLAFLQIRDEFPDLNSEIRSILLARAQEGATISQIRDDYRKLTGLTFPVYEWITDFLLSIPYVSAYCNEQGTLIFGVKPTEKTKHIHDLVMEQKNPNEQIPNVNHRRYRERQRNPNYQPNTYRRRSYYQPSGGQRKSLRSQCLVANVCNDANVSQDNSEGFVEDNWFYNDNCNYLLNRIHNQENILPPTCPPEICIPSLIYAASGDHQQQEQQVVQPLIETVAVAPNVNEDLHQFNANNLNINSAVPTYENNINHLNSLFQMARDSQHNTNHNNNMAVVNPPRSSSYIPCKNSMPRSSRSSSPTGKSCYTNDSMFTDTDYDAHLLDFLLMGDDFFLFMARMELRCKFKKHQRILQSGLCVSGQTINAAIKRINALNDNGRSIIVNIGSVNIMQRRQLVQIEHDFRELIKAMLKKGINPILTTLAPLANYNHENDVKNNLERFNEFIKREGEKRNLVVIDIWKCLANEKGHILFDCYQNQPRLVSGAAESYVFWNKIGRQRVLQLIESKLEY